MAAESNTMQTKYRRMSASAALGAFKVCSQQTTICCIWLKMVKHFPERDLAVCYHLILEVTLIIHFEN